MNPLTVDLEDRFNYKMTMDNSYYNLDDNLENIYENTKLNDVINYLNNIEENKSIIENKKPASKKVGFLIWQVLSSVTCLFSF